MEGKGRGYPWTLRGCLSSSLRHTGQGHPSPPPGQGRGTPRPPSLSLPLTSPPPWTGQWYLSLPSLPPSTSLPPSHPPPGQTMDFGRKTCGHAGGLSCFWIYVNRNFIESWKFFLIKSIKQISLISVMWICRPIVRSFFFEFCTLWMMICAMSFVETLYKGVDALSTGVKLSRLHSQITQESMENRKCYKIPHGTGNCDLAKKRP